MSAQTYTYFTDLVEQIPEIPPDTILSRTIYDDKLTKVILFAFAAGQELSEHTASRAAILHFLQGEAELTLGDDRQPAKVGTWVQMPPRLPHSIVAKTPVLMLLVMLAHE